MKIALLASNLDAVPPSGNGSAGQVVGALADSLVAGGHDVTLFAAGGSKTKAKLVKVNDWPLRQDNGIKPEQWPAYELQSCIKLEEMQTHFDVVHNHMGYQALSTMARLNTPNVTTIHEIIKPYCAPVYLRYAGLPYVAISEAAKKLNFPNELNYQTVIYNGINVSEFIDDTAGGATEGSSKRKYLLFLGRICRDKGTMEAIEIARKLMVPLIIAGKLEPADEPYFRTYVEPYLEPGKIDFIGEVDHSKKLGLFAGAKAVLYPIASDEAFGVVMAEAMASGTPVLALDRGSVREIVIDGKTGIIGQSVGELVSRFGEIQSIDSRICRERALELFSIQRMAARYEKMYAALVNARGVA